MKIKQTATTMKFKCNINTKQVIWMLAFLIGVGILVWQSQSTVATFFSFRTTVAISTETSNSLRSPTLVLCQEHKWDNGVFANSNEAQANFLDNDWVLKQFFRLNDKMNISLWFHGFLKPDSENINHNEFLPGRYTDLT